MEKAGKDGEGTKPELAKQRLVHLISLAKSGDRSYCQCMGDALCQRYNGTMPCLNVLPGAAIAVTCLNSLPALSSKESADASFSCWCDASLVFKLTQTSHPASLVHGQCSAQ